jgi:hypothetical protein
MAEVKECVLGGVMHGKLIRENASPSSDMRTYICDSLKCIAEFREQMDEKDALIRKLNERNSDLQVMMNETIDQRKETEATIIKLLNRSFGVRMRNSDLQILMHETSGNRKETEATYIKLLKNSFGVRMSLMPSDIHFTHHEINEYFRPPFETWSIVDAAVELVAAWKKGKTIEDLEHLDVVWNTDDHRWYAVNGRV